jgi:hypothetical protein
VNYSDVQKLESIEKQEAERHGLEFFKHIANEEMLRVIS